jgi:hypothetical protein
MDDVLSEAESFNEDDMYRQDDCMMVVTESSDDSDNDMEHIQSMWNVGNVF